MNRIFIYFYPIYLTYITSMKIVNYLKLTLTAVTLCLITVSAYAQDADQSPLTLLKEGNLRFVSSTLLHQHQDMARVDDLKSGQQPFVFHGDGKLHLRKPYHRHQRYAHQR